MCEWATCFQVDTVSRVYRALDNYTAARFRRRLRTKRKFGRHRGGNYPLSHLYLLPGPLGPAWARRIVDERVRSVPKAGVASR